MDTLRETVSNSMRSAGYAQYAQYAEPVITALEGRERDICGVLIEFGTRAGASRADVEDALRNAGMTLPGTTYAAASPTTTTATTPGAVQRDDTPDGPEDPVLVAIRDMQNTLAGLVGFARENGYRG